MCRHFEVTAALSGGPCCLLCAFCRHVCSSLRVAFSRYSASARDGDGDGEAAGVADAAGAGPVAGGAYVQDLIKRDRAEACRSPLSPPLSPPSPFVSPSRPNEGK